VNASLASWSPFCSHDLSDGVIEYIDKRFAALTVEFQRGTWLREVAAMWMVCGCHVCTPVPAAPVLWCAHGVGVVVSPVMQIHFAGAGTTAARRTPRSPNPR
jgi:hypothetical protein